MNAYYYDGDSRTIEHRVTGRMGLNELISLLQHLTNDFQHPWMTDFRYFYDVEQNETFIRISVTNDRPHKS